MYFKYTYNWVDPPATVHLCAGCLAQPIASYCIRVNQTWNSKTYESQNWYNAMTVTFCPWCGTVLPQLTESQIEELSPITEDEMDRRSP